MEVEGKEEVGGGVNELVVPEAEWVSVPIERDPWLDDV